MIEICNVSKSFGPVRALSDVSLTIQPGERVAFVGVNGSGKTTLLRALVGLLPVQGQVRIGGVDVARNPQTALAELAYIPQIAPPMEAPAGEVVRAFCDLRGLAMAQVAAQAALLGVALPAIAKVRFKDLSGGTKQKTLAALALAARCRWLVCDEPTANLDPAARAAFFGQVGERPADSALILCSHRTEEVLHLVDRVVELREGRVVRDVTLAELRDTLQAWRLEVDLARPDASAARWLADRAFSGSDGVRFGRPVNHAEKLQLTAELFAHHSDAVGDFRIVAGRELALNTHAGAGQAAHGGPHAA